MLPALAVTRPRAHQRGVGAAHGVGGAANLERADRLEQLELAPDLGRGVLGRKAHERRAQRRARDPLARGLDLVDRDHSSRLHAGARARARATASSAAARSSTAIPSERNTVSAPSPLRPGRSPISTSPSSATTWSGPDHALPERQPVLAASFSTDSRESTKSSAAASVATSSSCARRDARADRVDVRAAREPRALDHGRRRARREHDDVGALERLARAARDGERRPAAKRSRDCSARRSRVGRGRGEDRDALELAHQQQRLAGAPAPARPSRSSRGCARPRARARASRAPSPPPCGSPSPRCR